MADCCAPSSNGDSGGGDPNELSFDRETTDAAAQQVTLARMPVDGSAATVELYIAGSQTGPAAGDRGDRGGWFKAWVSCARSSTGVGFLITGTIGPTGYTDLVAAPWTTPGIPIGWAFIGVAIAGNDLVLNFNGAAGQTIQWKIRGHRAFSGGATA